MGTLRILRSIPDEASPFEGPLTARTSTSYVVTSGPAVTTWSGSGITYDDAGVPISGTLTGFVMKIAGTAVATFTGIRADISKFGYDQDGADIIFGGGDIFYGSSSAEKDINLGLGNDTYYAGGGNDNLSEQGAGAGADKLYGEAGADTLSAGAGNDYLDGGANNDTLRGEAGNDTLVGGGGTDKLYGGTGADRFVFKGPGDSLKGSVHDTIFDFWRVQGDKIDLSAIDANGNGSGNGTFGFVGGDSFGGTSAELRYANGILSGDINGDRIADFEIKVVSAKPLLEGDLIL